MSLPAYKVKIDGEYLPNAYGAKVAAGSLNIKYDQAGTRGVLTFDIIDENFTNNSENLYYFEAVSGKRVQVYENVNGDFVLIYGGKIYEPETRKINMKPETRQKISCVDNHECCDRRLINNSYPKMLISDLFKDICDEYLADEGIWYTASSIQTTTSSVSINCPYIYCSKVFDELVDLIGWQWYIAPNKKLYLNDGTYERGAELNEYDGHLFDSFKIKDDMSEYRNKEILRKVNAVTDELTEIANPLPNNNRSYYVRFKLNKKPKIYITIERYKNDPRDSDLVDPRYVGINGISSDMYWYWSKNENTITQDESRTELTSGQYLVLKYYGQYELDIVKQDDAEIERRKAIEGGTNHSTGIYEEAVNGDGIEGILVAETKAQADLDRYANVAKKFTASSYVHRWQNAQLCKVVFPSFNQNGDCLVYNLNIVDMQTHLRRDCTLIDGQAIGGWINFFKKWMAKEDDFIIREDAEIVETLDITEEESWAGNITFTKLTCLYPGAAVFPSNALYPGTIAVGYPKTYTD